ncbi:MAG: hypothetical protein ACRDZQ_08680 [Acidimicrobiales bacterium]
MTTPDGLAPDGLAPDRLDLLGRPVEATEAELLEVYRRLAALAGRDDLAPCVTANVRHALSFVAVAVADLGLCFEHLLDVGT